MTMIVDDDLGHDVPVTLKRRSSDSPTERERDNGMPGLVICGLNLIATQWCAFQRFKIRSLSRPDFAAGM
jgi:hypothetical protein